MSSTKSKRCPECGRSAPGHSILCSIGLRASNPPREETIYTQSQMDAALQHREQEVREQTAKVLTDRADELQTEWDAPPSAENGFVEMTADTPAGYATWYCAGQLRKLAQIIRRDDTPQEGEQLNGQ